MQAKQYLDIDPLFASWLTGFIDGEGCFLIPTRTGGKAGRGYSCVLSIGLRADDRSTLELICNTTGVGKVSQNQMWPSNTRHHPGGKPYAKWNVVAKSDVHRMTEILDAHPLRSKKARDYEVWREAAKLWLAMTHRLGEAGDWTGFAELRDQLTNGRRYVEVAS